MPMYQWCHDKAEDAEPTCEKETSTIKPVAEHDQPPEKCEHCGYTGTKWRKVLGGGNFVLSGYGWARDGYQ